MEEETKEKGDEGEGGMENGGMENGGKGGGAGKEKGERGVPLSLFTCNS
jgi:hypothetical protein